MSKVAVIGGGAAGMMAACAAAENGHQVTLYERNEKLGKKIYITGKGRCNLTNACDTEELFAAVKRNAKFLYSAIYGFDNQAVMQYFERLGLAIKTERGNRVFPQSDHASDVIRALADELRRKHVKVCLNTKVTQICRNEAGISGVIWDCSDTKERQQKTAYDAVIVACGGVSYPTTGSDGSGFELCRELGHTVTELRPSLIGMTTKEGYIPQLQGLSLKNVSLTIKDGKKVLYSDFGEMLFTHQGISGPLVLTTSSCIPDKSLGKELPFWIDLKPALTREQLDKRLQREFSENLNRQFKNAVHGLVPAKMLPVLIELSAIDPEKKVHSVTKEERGHLLELLKAFPGTITGLGRMEEAIITRGGIKVKEVNPSTMESKLVPGLYLCGEMLDVDAVTGGFNLQIAWSTGYLAGSSVSSNQREV